MKKEFEKRMFTVEVKKSGFSGIYRGAGTKEEVLDDVDFLRKRGLRNEELEIKPILGKPRQEPAMRAEDRQLLEQTLEKTTTTRFAYTRGFAWGVGLTSLAVGVGLLYNSFKSKSKNDEEKDEE